MTKNGIKMGLMCIYIYKSQTLFERWLWTYWYGVSLNMSYIRVFKRVVMKEDLLDCCSGLAIATATNSSYLFFLSEQSSYVIESWYVLGLFHWLLQFTDNYWQVLTSNFWFSWFFNIFEVECVPNGCSPSMIVSTRNGKSLVTFWNILNRPFQ